MESVRLNRDYVARINLKTECEVSWEELIIFCLGNLKEQYLAIGWNLNIWG